MDNMLLWAIIGSLISIIIILLLKINLLQKAADEIKDAFEARLTCDTNTLIDISSRDRHMRSLAATVNTQLRHLRTKRHRFQHGDRELKNAVTNISHDLRTPLTAIFGYLDLLEKEETSASVRNYANIIRNRSELLAKLTEELFQYSIILASKDELSLKPVNLNQALEESIAAFYTVLHQNGITPHVRIPEQKIMRNLDPYALSRIFSNLLSNAVKYSSGDLDITLSENGEIIFSNRAFGLNSVQAGRLFDRFYTVESARKSTGLGLFIARALVEQMGGSIRSEYKNGILYIYILF